MPAWRLAWARSAFGTDGGGSIRIPASYTGLVGIKPSFGRVPHAPMDSPFSLNVSGGPLAHTVGDAARLLNEVCRPDWRDPWAAPYDARDWTIGLDDGVRGSRVAATTDLGGAEILDPDVSDAWRAALDALTERGARVEVVGPLFEPLRPRFENHWKAGFANILLGIPKDRWAQCDPGFLALAREGLDVPMSAFSQAMAARAELIVELAEFHERYDLVVTPTMPTVAPRADVVYHFSDFDRWTHAVPYTLPFNLTGQPAAVHAGRRVACRPAHRGAGGRRPLPGRSGVAGLPGAGSGRSVSPSHTPHSPLAVASMLPAQS